MMGKTCMQGKGAGILKIGKNIKKKGK